MTWSYDLTQLGENGKDAVRFFIQDTVATNHLVEDEEIIFALGQGGMYRAASIVCRSISAEFSRKVSVQNKESGIFDEMQKKADHYLKLAEDYAEQAGRSGLTVFAGGISLSDKESRATDADATAPAFTRDLHLNTSLNAAADPTAHF
jgi:hypothetical protein